MIFSSNMLQNSCVENVCWKKLNRKCCDVLILQVSFGYSSSSSIICPEIASPIFVEKSSCMRFILCGKMQKPEELGENLPDSPSCSFSSETEFKKCFQLVFLLSQIFFTVSLFIFGHLSRPHVSKINHFDARRSFQIIIRAWAENKIRSRIWAKVFLLCVTVWCGLLSITEFIFLSMFKRSPNMWGISFRSSSLCVAFFI